MNAERRYVARSYGTGKRDMRWGVFDRVTSSWPIQRAELGIVLQAMVNQKEAEAEADRCEATRPKP